MNENIILYTTHCPKCKALTQKLDMKGIKYATVDDTSAVIEFAKEHNIISAPILVVGDQVLSFIEANTWVNKQ